MRGAWLARLLLAALLGVGFDLVGGRLPAGYDDIDRLALVVGCVALSAALLDLMQRERARDIIGLLALAGLGAMAAGLVIFPRSALNALPLSLLTDMLGAPTALALWALLSWLALLRGRSSVALLVLALAGGALWGLAESWQPATSAVLFLRRPLPTLLVAPALVGAVIWLVQRYGRGVTPDALPLSRRGWALVGALLLALLGLRVAQGLVDVFALVIVGGLMAFTWWIARLYRLRAVTLAERTLPFGGLRPSLLWALVAYVAAGLAGSLLPREEADTILSAVMLAFGLTWLPALSLVIGFRALSRQIRAQQL